MCAAKCAYAPMASLASACGGGACMIGRCLRLPYFGRACMAGPWALDGAKGAVPVHALYGQELAQVRFLLVSLCFALCPRHGVPLLDEILSLCELHGQGEHTWKDRPLVTPIHGLLSNYVCQISVALSVVQAEAELLPDGLQQAAQGPGAGTAGAELACGSLGRLRQHSHRTAIVRVKEGLKGQAQSPGAGRWGQGVGGPGVRHSGQAASASMWSKMALTVPRARPLPTQVKAQSAQNLCPHSRPSGWYITSCRGCNPIHLSFKKLRQRALTGEST